jgi:hypothetical protein
LNNIYVAVGNGGAIFTSADAANWVLRSVSLPGDDGTLEGVAYGNGLFLAVGGYELHTNSDSTAHSVLVTSPDGVTWTVQTPDFGKKLRAVSFVNGEFLGVGNDGLVINSADGFLWHQQFIAGPLENLRWVQALPGLVTIIGNDGIVFSSPDGSAWKRNRLFTSKNLHGAAYGKGILVATGSDGAVLRADGVLPKLAVQRVPKTAAIQFSVENGAHDYYRLQVSGDEFSWRDLQVLTNGVVPPPLSETNLLDTPRLFFRLQNP